MIKAIISTIQGRAVRSITGLKDGCLQSFIDLPVFIHLITTHWKNLKHHTVTCCGKSQITRIFNEVSAITKIRFLDFITDTKITAVIMKVIGVTK